MPTYDYRCNACEHTFELVQTMSASVKRKCPSCAKLKLERLIGTGAGFIIKGRTSPPSSVAASSEPSSTSTPSDSDSSSPSGSTSSDTASSASTDTNKTSTDSGSAKADTSDSKSESAPAEKCLSGSTSTPTHRAREHRGVGNLVDKARRMAVTKSTKAKASTSTAKPKCDAKGKPAKKRPPAKKSRRKPGRG
jgi:putative FmdB family regulatory protein